MLFGIVLAVGNLLYGLVYAVIFLPRIFGAKAQHWREVLQAREKGLDQRVSEVKLSRNLWLAALLALTPVTAVSTYGAIIRNTQSYVDQNPGSGSGGEWVFFGSLSWMVVTGIITRLIYLRYTRKALDAIGQDDLKFKRTGRLPGYGAGTASR